MTTLKTYHVSQYFRISYIDYNNFKLTYKLFRKHLNKYFYSINHSWCDKISLSTKNPVDIFSVLFLIISQCYWTDMWKLPVVSPMCTKKRTGFGRGSFRIDTFTNFLLFFFLWNGRARLYKQWRHCLDEEFFVRLCRLKQGRDFVDQPTITWAHNSDATHILATRISAQTLFKSNKNKNILWSIKQQAAIN